MKSGYYLLGLLVLYTTAFNQDFHPFEAPEVTPKGSFQVGGCASLLMDWSSFSIFEDRSLFFSPGLYAKFGVTDNLEFGVGLSSMRIMTVTGKYQFSQRNDAISLHGSFSGYIEKNYTSLYYSLEPFYITGNWLGNGFGGVRFFGVITSENGKRTSVNILSLIWGGGHEFRIGRQGAFRLKVPGIFITPLVAFDQEGIHIPTTGIASSYLGLGVAIAYVKPTEEVRYRRR